MKGITWSRDSHGLFDYESRHLTKKTMKTEQEIIIMRHTNELITSNYSRVTPFEDQVNAMTMESEDKALLKIVNHNENTFYLESASCNLMNEEDMRQPGQPALGLSNLNENMYLVVRSLKLNNEKIVSWLITENLLSHFYRTTKFRKKTFLRSVELNLLLRRLAMQATPTTWKWTSPKNSVRSTVTAPTASSTNPMTNYSKNSKKSSRLS